MLYKIYFDERCVILSLEKQKKHHNTVVFKDKDMLKCLLENFETSNEPILFIVHTDIEELFKAVIACFKYVETAGGVVQNKDGKILIIRRFGKWDLPKGKIEKGESPQNAALREVVEECGLNRYPTITNYITQTFHTYRDRNGKFALKRTIWYAMNYDGDEQLTPQTIEHIEDAKWINRAELPEIQLNTYNSIRDVLSLFA
jgi:ADP-ribose pyrophosphatase YjhB (NUDIX family)